MPINTTTLPFINKMLMPASGAEAGQGIADFIGGFMGAYEARSRLDKADEEANAEIVARGGEPNPPHRFQNFVKAFNRAPGVIKEGETPFGETQGRILSAQAKGLERTNSLNEQLDRLVRDPVGLANEPASLPVDELPNWLIKNAGLRANPIGAKIWDGVSQAYRQTRLGQIETAKAKYLADLAIRFPWLDPTNPDDLAQAQELMKTVPSEMGGVPLSTVKIGPTGIPEASYDVLRGAQAGLADTRADILENPPDLSNIAAQPIYGAKGEVVSYAMPNGRGGIHYVTPGQSGQVTFGVAPNGQRYVTTGKGIHLLHDIEHEAKVKIAVTGLNDVNQRIRDLESSARLKPEEQAKRLAPLLKQKDELEKALKAQLPEVTPEASPAPIPSQGKADILEEARLAIKKGAPRDKVIERLRNLGITEEP